jgi:hypothetical protein
VYLADFGLSQIGWQPRPDREDVNRFIGTIGFAPLAALNRKQQAPIDDLESLGYTLAFLACVHLPWWYDLSEQVVKRKMEAETVFCAKVPVVATFILTVRNMAVDALVPYDTFEEWFKQGPNYVPPPLNGVA